MMKKNIPVLLLVLCAVFIPLGFMKSNYFIQLFQQVLIYIVAIMGLNIVMGQAGLTNLGTIGIIGVGAYGAAMLARALDSSTLLCLLLAVVLGLVLGLMLGFPSLRVKGTYLTITTLGFSQIVYLLLNNWVDFTGGPMGVRGYPYLCLLGFKLESAISYYYFLLVITILCVAFCIRLSKSKFGRSFRALRDNDEALESLGINIATIKVLAFTLAAIFGCLSGALYAFMSRYVSPNAFAMEHYARYTQMIIIGGMGNIYGSIVGAIFVTIVPELMRDLTTQYQLIFNIITFVFIMTYPDGLLALGKEIIRKIAGALGGAKNGNIEA